MKSIISNDHFRVDLFAVEKSGSYDFKYSVWCRMEFDDEKSVEVRIAEALRKSLLMSEKSYSENKKAKYMLSGSVAFIPCYPVSEGLVILTKPMAIKNWETIGLKE